MRKNPRMTLTLALAGVVAMNSVLTGSLQAQSASGKPRIVKPPLPGTPGKPPQGRLKRPDEPQEKPRTSKQIRVTVMLVDIAIPRDNKQPAPIALTASKNLTSDLKKLDAAGHVTRMQNFDFNVIENQKATLQFGAETPIPTGRTSLANGRGGLPVSRTSYSTVTTGQTTAAQARVDGQQILLEISYEESQVHPQPKTDDENPRPRISQAQVATTVSVPNGGTVLLSSLVTRDEQQHKQQAIFVTATMIED